MTQAKPDRSSGRGKKGGAGGRPPNQDMLVDCKIDEARMRSGEDRRTTLMLRNIPNKYLVTMLIATFDALFADYKSMFDFVRQPGTRTVSRTTIVQFGTRIVAPVWDSNCGRCTRRFESHSFHLVCVPLATVLPTDGLQE